jgi:hypothetical protein
MHVVLSPARENGSDDMFNGLLHVVPGAADEGALIVMLYDGMQ